VGVMVCGTGAGKRERLKEAVGVLKLLGQKGGGGVSKREVERKRFVGG